MSTTSIFNCTLSQCLVPCLITFGVTVFIMGIITLIIYFKLVSMAKRRFGIENFSIFNDDPLINR